MDMTWVAPQIALDFYQTCLTVLVWVLASFACLGILASVMFLCVECAAPLPDHRGLAQRGHTSWQSDATGPAGRH